ncbi:MAG TPA: radical SAM protein [Isosphaeraceae bacterium]|jgi:radical SAM superfamily enzyme YgiQ (UPF0313 family)|nr:radical SAM protein [Isosphaeraceae bacterium]
MADIVLINPRFDMSFWGMELVLPFIGRRANMPVASLPLLAALTPPKHRVTLIDENAEPIDFDRCARADIVGLTGMGIQRHRMKEIVDELKGRGAFVVIGGPMATVNEGYFDGQVDALFVGEAEETWPRFLEEWEQGRHGHRYEQAEPTDVTTIPTPRFDMLKMNRYLFGSVQFSRGCPFQCEFCDIIVTFGRRPRIKAPEQVIAEIEAMREQGVQIAFIVDDNLIGNKRGIRPVLRAVADWQRRRGYTMTFFTEASIDLADDPELMELMVDANIISVFVGIESPNEDSLRETKKFQNVRRGPSMIEKVHAIQAAGLEVWCGMIAGFDNDDETIFDRQIQFLEEARIASGLVGLLHAIPRTPLYDRLRDEGRLDDADDTSGFSTNVIPLQMSREQLQEGYVRVLRTLYDPENYFRRLESLFIDARIDMGRSRARYWRRHPLNALRTNTLFLLHAAGLFARMMTGIPEPALRREYRRRVARLIRARPDPGTILTYVFKCAMHYHAYTMARRMSGERTAVLSGY